MADSKIFWFCLFAASASGCVAQQDHTEDENAEEPIESVELALQGPIIFDAGTDVGDPPIDRYMRVLEIEGWTQSGERREVRWDFSKPPFSGTAYPKEVTITFPIWDMSQAVYIRFDFTRWGWRSCVAQSYKDNVSRIRYEGNYQCIIDP